VKDRRNKEAFIRILEWDLFRPRIISCVDRQDLDLDGKSINSTIWSQKDESGKVLGFEMELDDFE